MRIPDAESIIRALSRKHMLSFVRHMYPAYQAGWVHCDVCEKLMNFFRDVQEKKSPRLILSIPPRHGKSELVSRRFPAWCFGQNPNLSIISTSYSATIASRFNRDVQRIMEDPVYQAIFRNVRIGDKRLGFLKNSDMFEIVGASGVYQCAGVGGSITGMGADILIIDDPVKDFESAHSPTMRENVWDWYTSTAYTRLSQGGGVLVIMTRWHHDDLVGRLLKAQENGGEKWTNITYPAIAEQDEAHRRRGEPLHSERYSLADLRNIQKTIGVNKWLSLYQQRPTVEGGGMIKLHWFQRYEKQPDCDKIVFSIDTAYKAKEHSDYSVCEVWGVADNAYYLLDVWRETVTYPDLKRNVMTLTSRWRPSEILIEYAASGQSLIQDLTHESRLPVIPIGTEGKSKIIRMDTEAPVIEAGRCFLPVAADWLHDFEQEAVQFPSGKHDDMIDALSQFLKRQRQSPRSYKITHMENRQIQPIRSDFNGLV